MSKIVVEVILQSGRLFRTRTWKPDDVDRDKYLEQLTNRVESRTDSAVIDSKIVN